MFAQEERIAISIFKKEKRKGKRDGQGWLIGDFQNRFQTLRLNGRESDRL